MCTPLMLGCMTGAKIVLIFSKRLAETASLHCLCVRLIGTQILYKGVVPAAMSTFRNTTPTTPTVTHPTNPTTMLNADILILVFESCDLESGLALSQVCRLNHVLYQHLGHMIRKKVQKRVPWMTPSSVRAKTWRGCAAIIVARSRKGLDPNNKHLYLLKDLSVAVSLGTNDTQILPCVDLQTDENTRTKMKPIFTGENYTKVTPRDMQKGHNLYYPGISLNLTNMITSKSSYNASQYREYHRLTNEAVSPSGLVVRHKNRNFALRVMAENENLLHVRFRFEGQDGDVLIYKHEPRDTDAKDGAILITAQTTPTFYGPTDRFDVGLQGSVVSLLPGHGGALVVTAPSSREHLKMLVYVEPDASMRSVLICSLPASTTYRDGYSDFDTRFFTTFDGYLFLYFEGRLVRLWVDLGYRSSASALRPVDVMLREKASSRCLTVWDRKFPLIGGFGSAEPGFCLRGHLISRGCTKTLARYVTVGSACGTAFGDLSSGKTYYSRNSSSQGLTMPLICREKIQFGVFGPHVATSLIAAMLLTDRASTHGLDLSCDFEHYCEQAVSRNEKLTARTDLETLQDKRVPFPDSSRNRDMENEAPFNEFRDPVLHSRVIVPDEDEEDGDNSESDSEYDSDFADGPDLIWYDHLGDERNHPYGEDTDDEEEEFGIAEAYIYDDVYRQLPLVDLNNVTMNRHDEFESVPSGGY